MGPPGDPADQRENLNYLMQGVTTVATGNDGSSPWPIADRLAQWRKNGVGTNVALYVGFGSVRQRVLGSADRAPTATELAQEEALVAQGMREGAIGISTGLFYVPQSFSQTPEVVALAKVAAGYGGIYDTHLRDESSYTVGLKAAVAEAIEIGRQAQLPIMISHIKCLGADVWGEAPAIVQMIDRARAQGLNVVANQYPYRASLTSLEAAVIPNWAEAGGRKQFLARIQSPATHQRLLREIPALIAKRGGPGTLVLVHYTADPSLEGKSLAGLAAQWHLSPAAAALRICAKGSTGVVSHNMQEADLETFMRQDWVATASDGESARPGTFTHPRSFGTFAVKLQRYVAAQRTLTLAFAVRAATSLPAAIAGFDHRGLVAPGYYADLVVFDLAQVASPATYGHPGQYARGFVDVVVNGQFAVRDGQPTHRLAGKVLLGPGAGH
ncbi:MAG TPA: amidohydrolase family protein [Terriglobales bacterium]|nr:amidohydrolase family protein [Terriglobales bacterium]